MMMMLIMMMVMMMMMMFTMVAFICRPHNTVDIQPPDGHNLFFGFGRRLLHANDHLHPLLVHHHHHHHHHHQHHDIEQFSNIHIDGYDGTDNVIAHSCLRSFVVVSAMFGFFLSAWSVSSSFTSKIFSPWNILWPGAQSPLRLSLKSLASSCSPLPLAPSPLSGASLLSLVSASSSSWIWSSWSLTIILVFDDLIWSHQTYAQVHQSPALLSTLQEVVRSS